MIRLATLLDHDTLFEACKECYYATPKQPAPFDPASVSGMIQDFITDETKTIILAEKPEFIGMLFAFATPLFYNTQYYQAYELLWWVSPEHRKHRDALRLFFCYEAWAEKVGCVSVTTGELPSWASLERFYLKHGYQKTVTGYRKDLWVPN